MNAFRWWVDSAGTLVIHWNDTWVTHIGKAGYLLLAMCIGISFVMLGLIIKPFWKAK